MPLTHNQIVAARFAARARDYERHAGLQAGVAERLASLAPDMERPSVLEVGCGTGLLTRHLLERYPGGEFLVTDMAEEMVAACRARHKPPNGRALHFAVMDGEAPDTAETFDVIALSMTLQWFSDPIAGLNRLTQRLRPGGKLLYATIAPGCFPEWRAALDACGLTRGWIDMPELRGILDVENRVVDYGTGLAFLDALRAIGATTPRPGYAPQPPGKLRAALRRLEETSGGRVTWRIAYGLISADDGFAT